MMEFIYLSNALQNFFNNGYYDAGTGRLFCCEGNPQVLRLTESLKNTISRMNELVKNEGYKLNFQYKEDIHISADEVKITQAFYNLLLNAITHCGDDKTVIVRQNVKENVVRIEVIDKQAVILYYINWI